MTRRFIFSLLFFLVAAVVFTQPTQAASLGADAYCDHPASYRFRFNDQDVSIEHCGRTDKGVLDYTVTSPESGKLMLYHNAPRTTVRLKVNGKSYTEVVEGNGVWRSEIMVKKGDKISLLADMGDRPYSGWISPQNQQCNGFFGAGASDVSDLYKAISNDGSKLVSAQCWGDGYAHERLLKESRSQGLVTVSCSGSAKDCHDVLIEDMDFNDGAFFLAVDPKIAHASVCEDLKIVRGNNAKVPAKVSFSAVATDNLGSIQMYRFLFGDGSKLETEHAEVDHTYESSGKFEAVLEVKDSKGNWIKSEACEASVRVAPVNIESHRSSCSYLNIVSGQNTQAPAVLKFKVAGFDNKGDIKAYRVDFGDGQQTESSGTTFEHRYDKPGTYKVKAEIKDSTDQWRSDDDCMQTVYVSTQPITSQPSTGTPTWLTIAGLTGGALAFAYPFIGGTKRMNKALHASKKKR